MIPPESSQDTPQTEESGMTTQLYLTPKDQGRELSLEEFEGAGALEGYHYELIDGKLQASPLPDMPHEELRDWLRDALIEYGRTHSEIINHVTESSIANVTGERGCVSAPSASLGALTRPRSPCGGISNAGISKAPARVFVPGRRATTAPEPDVAAYHNFPLNLPLRQRRWRDHSPILVAEIISADAADKDLIRNHDLYLLVPSIREYWIIDPRANPDRPSLTVHRRRGQRWQQAIEIASGDTYTTRLLPGFALTMDVLGSLQ
jgi:Uma2 family endonuclease